MRGIVTTIKKEQELENKDKKDKKKKKKQKKEEIALFKEEKVKKIDHLNNVLLLDVVRLLKKLVKFDVLTLLNKTEVYYTILPYLFTFLEFDKNHPSFSYGIQQIRSIALPP